VKRDTRLSLALHALVTLANARRAMTSTDIARRLGANPVVLRRTMAGLRDAGIVGSRSGTGGGWGLLRDVSQLTVGQVYDALEMSTPFAWGHRRDTPRCPAELAVHRALDAARDAAEAELLAFLRRLCLADLAAEATLGVAE
jgi:Rrf2 family protein